MRSHPVGPGPGLLETHWRGRSQTLGRKAEATGLLSGGAMTKPVPPIELPDNLLAFAQERVRSGEYANLAEVVEDAFRLLLQRHERRQMLRAELADVLQQMDDNELAEGSE